MQISHISYSGFFKKDASAEKHETPKLEVINKMIVLLKGQRFLSHLHDKILFIGTQHNLETTAVLYESLIAIGADPKKMYFAGKCYSTNPKVASSITDLDICLIKDKIPSSPGMYQEACRNELRDLWFAAEKKLNANTEIDTIIIIDDGGCCFEEMPNKLKIKYKIAGLEQTKIDPYLNLIPCPIIEVATSAAKKKIESPQIAAAVFRRIKSLSLTSESVCGIIGNGAIGDAITTYIINTLQAKALVYDASAESFLNTAFAKKIFRVASAAAVIANADYIFGCTGQDVTNGIDVLELCKGKKKIFISCTSEDKEFNKLLLNIELLTDKKFNPLEDIKFTYNDCDITIVNGGFPANFDRTPWNVPAQDIELTQCLMFGGIIQATLCAKTTIEDGITINKTERIMLDTVLQARIVKEWSELLHNQKKCSPELLESFKDESWIREHSLGTYKLSALSEIMAFKELEKVSEQSPSPVMGMSMSSSSCSSSMQ